MQLFDVRGQRKYLTQHERDRFLKAARSAPTPVRAFCEILAYTGCRLSEALALTPDRVDPAAGVVVFESLKKRRRGVFRAVPVPTGLLETLARLQLRNARFSLDSTLWSWSRTTAWRRVRAVMRSAEVEGAAATPKGLRHAFGIVAVAAAVPVTIIQKWMGHSDVATTAIYLDVSGAEERLIAIRMGTGSFGESLDPWFVASLHWRNGQSRVGNALPTGPHTWLDPDQRGSPDPGGWFNGRLQRIYASPGARRFRKLQFAVPDALWVLTDCYAFNLLFLFERDNRHAILLAD